MNYRKIFIPFIAVMLLFTSSCQKEKTAGRDYPQLRTVAVDHITSEGARFNAVIISGSCESVTEYGFVWGNTDEPSVQNSEKIMAEEAPPEDQFHFDVTFALEATKDYFVRSFIKSGDLVIYGEPVKFISLGSQAPVITDFEPKSATWGDTITIYGKNFSFQPMNNIVIFGQIAGKIVNSTNEKIWVIVPENISDLQNVISVELFGNRISFELKFNLIIPVSVTSISPTTVSWLDTLTLSGLFSQDFDIKVTINNTESEIYFRNSNEIKVKVPPNLLNYSLNIAIIFNNHTMICDQFDTRLKLPYVNENVNYTGYPGDTITLTGLFSPIKEYNLIRFQGTTTNANITFSSLHRLSFIVPNYVNGFQTKFDFTSGNVPLLDDEIFNYKLPVLSSISPESGGPGDEIKIKGNHFMPGKTLLFLGTYYQITNATITETEITFNLPEDIPNGVYVITITMFYNSINSDFTFEVIKP